MSDQIDDFTMAYQDTCDQMTLLLIHGFPLDSAMWELQLQDLADVARLIAPDLRGHGRSDAVPGPYSMKLFSDDIAGLLDYLNIDDPVVIGGLSMGGYIALDFYRRYPERVAGLILAATRAGADSDDGKANREAAAATVRAEGIGPIVTGMLPKLMAPASYVLGEIAVPALIVHGAEDQIIPLAEAEAMAVAIPASQLVVIPNAGHLPNLEQPDIFNDAVLDFLEKFEEHDHEH